MTGATLAAGLFANTELNVGNNAVIFPGTIGQFASNSESYLQVNLQNLNGNGSSDFVATADIGSDTEYYMDVGVLGSTYDNTNPDNSLGSSASPLDGYIYVQGGAGSEGGNIIFGTTKTGKEIRFLVGGVEDVDVQAKLSETGFTLTQKPILFADGTSQNTAVAQTYVQVVETYADTANTSLKSYVDVANTSMKSYVDTTVSTANTSLKSYVDVANTSMKSYVDTTVSTANTSLKSYADNKFLANTTGTFNGSLTTTGDVTVIGAFYAANTIRTPTVFAGSQTAITLSFTNSALVKANTAAGVTITPANFVSGKFIDVYITNTDNSQHSITHGVAAINSSTGTTSFNLGGSRTAYLRYASFDGDLANTYVTVTYS
jgi:hypothetical protein